MGNQEPNAPSSSPMNRPSNRPGFAVICNSVPPYREHLHRRIVREIPDVKLWTVCTHEGDDARWQHQPPEEINPISFGREPGIVDRHGLNWASFRKGGRIIDWIRKSDIRAVLVMGYNDLGRLRIIRWCHKNNIACFVFGDSNIRGDRASGFVAVYKRLLLGWVTSHVAGMMACGSLGRAYFEKYGADPKRIYYVPYEPDYKLIASISDEQLNEAREKLELAKDRRRIVYSGRLVRDKRVDLLLDAFQAIADRRPEWDLIILGDGPLRVQLEQSVLPRLRERIRFIGFLPDPAWVGRVYRLCDVLALPSDYEPWALVINEAAAAGMAIVCTDVVGAAAELVEPGVNGELFAPGDVAALREHLLQVTEPATLHRYRAASQNVLTRWRERGDPIRGIRQALRDNRVLPP